MPEETVVFNNIHNGAIHRFSLFTGLYPHPNITRSFSYSRGADFDNQKGKTSWQILLQLRRIGVDLAGKVVLEIGLRTGENASAMKAAGATVYAVEPDRRLRNEAVRLGRIERNKIFGKFPSRHKGTYDIATVFLYNIFAYHEKQKAKFAESLAKAIKPDGIAIIGVSGESNISDKSFGVKALMLKYFWSVKEHDFAQTANRYFFVCRLPKT
jgi:SAM-dependent methyltransferase